MIFNLKKNWDAIHRKKLFKTMDQRNKLVKEIKEHHKSLHKTKIKDNETYILYDYKLRQLDKLITNRFEIEKKLIAGYDKGAFRD